jgi:glycosyltransferase involved in cell wall biosynthesis
VQHHILILDNELEMGGKEKLLFQYLERYDRRRFRVTVCCLKQGGYYKERIRALGIPFHDGLLRHRYDALSFRSLARILRAEKVQLIETFTHPNTALFSFLARQQGLVDRVLISHHAMGSGFRKRVLPSYIVPVLRRMDAHLAVADAQRRYLVDVEKVPRERVHLVYNGIDAEQYRPPAPGERDSARRSLGVPEAGLVLMAVGSLKPLKGFDLLVRAANPLLMAHPEARLVLVGDGRDRGMLETLARECGVGAQVVFAGLRDDVNVVLRAADLLVLSSRTEALPTVILEAMATGLPVVTTNVGGVPEIVESERSALVVPPDNEDALRTAIERAAGSVELRRTLGARGRAIVETRFRLERMCEEREALFETILATRSSRRVANNGNVS